jgi:DNA-binding NarL/FixJ family response regulator
MPSVVVADVVPLVRLGLATVLHGEGYVVVAEVASAREVAKAVVEHSPQLAVVGAVNDLSIDDLARQVAEAGGGVRLVVLLGRAPRDTLADLLAVAVDGLLSRSIDGPSLVRAVERVMAGERYVDPTLLTGDAPDEEFEPMALTVR